MEPESADASAVSPRLEKAIGELQALHSLLLSGEGLEPRILSDFRDAVSRVRNTAWSAQQYLASKTAGEDSRGVLSLLAVERVRTAYQLCQAIQADLQSDDVRFKTGQLIELSLAAKSLVEQLERVIGKL